MVDASNTSPVLPRETPAAAPSQPGRRAGHAGPGNARHRRNPGATDAGRADVARSGGESNPAMPQACGTALFRNSAAALCRGCRGTPPCLGFHRVYAPEVHRAIAAEFGRTGIPLIARNAQQFSRRELILQLAQLESEPARLKFR